MEVDCPLRWRSGGGRHTLARARRRGKSAFCRALRYHPAFISSEMFADLPLPLPALTLEVDSIAEGAQTLASLPSARTRRLDARAPIDAIAPRRAGAGAVGVEWHVEVGGVPFPLGRGLTQASAAAHDLGAVSGRIKC